MGDDEARGTLTVCLVRPVTWLMMLCSGDDSIFWARIVGDAGILMAQRCPIECGDRISIGGFATVIPTFA